MNNDSYFNNVMKQHAISFLVILALVVLPQEFLQAQFHLRDAAAAALEHSSALRAAEYGREAQSAHVRAAWGRLLPQVEMDVLYTHMNDDMVLNLDPIRTAIIGVQTGNSVALTNIESLLTQGRALTDAERQAVATQAQAQLDDAIPHFQETLKEQTFLQGAIVARQPIFTGGKIAAGIRAAKALERSAVADYHAGRANVLQETASRYLDVLLARHNLTVRREAAEAIGRHDKRAQRLMETGVIAKHDRQRADVALSDAERNLFEAEERLHIASIALASVTGCDTVPAIGFDTLAYIPTIQLLDDFLVAGMAGNHTLAKLRSTVDALEEKGNAHFADYFPSVYGFGMYNMFSHYMIPDAEPTWAIGLGIHLTLFNGLQRSSAHQNSSLQTAAMREHQSEAERQITLLLRKNWMEMQLQQKQYLKLDAALLQAEENVRLHTRRYTAGMATSLEVIDAELGLESIRLKRASALHDMYMHLLDLHVHSGNIDGFFAHWDHPQIH